MLDIKELKIVIIGGGPAGLSMARLLQLNEFKNVIVTERDVDRNVRVGGSSLDLHDDSGLIFIEKANLMKEFLNSARPEGESIGICDKNGNIILKKPHLKINSKKPEIDRGVLRNLLVDSLKPNTIKWNHQFKSLKQLSNGKTLIEFKNESIESIEADLVIGADGSNSKVRPYVNGDLKLQYSGITLIEFEVSEPKIVCPKIYELVDNGLFYALSDGKGFIIQLKGDGNLIIYLSCKRPENWLDSMETKLDFKSTLDQLSINSIKEFIKNDVLSDWNSMFHNVIDNGILFRSRPLYTIPIYPEMNQWKSQSPITLIGDAAHTIVPYAGKGLNSGMMDTVELLQCLLEDHSSLTLINRLNNYEEMMHKRMYEVAKDSLDAQDIVHSKDACFQLTDRFLGNYKYFKSILPYFIYSLNYFTDLLGFSK